jgi:hypothetical protein
MTLALATTWIQVRAVTGRGARSRRDLGFAQ